MPFLTPEQRQILKKSALCAKLDDNQCTYFFEVVERTKLDPFTGQIRPDVRMNKTGERDERGQDIKAPSLLIIVTLQGLRVVADRTGEMKGEDPWKWCGEDGEWKEVWLLKEMPVAARAVTHREGRIPQIAVVRFDAVSQSTYDKHGNIVPTSFWKKMGSHMVAKCAQAASIRGAFPNQCSGLYIAEEVAEVLDEDSEQAIEAEMIRRSRAEKEYWEKEAEKGNYPVGKEFAATHPRIIGDQVPMESETKTVTEKMDARTEAAKPEPKKEVPKRRQPAPVPVTASQEDLLGPTAGAQVPTDKREAPIPTNITPIKIDGQPWAGFVLTRIELFKGRTVGDLTAIEMKGLEPWLVKVEQAWANLDEDFKAHYKALKERANYDYQRQLETLADGLDFGTPA
jgi:phage recombination protein Bet